MRGEEDDEGFQPDSRFQIPDSRFQVPDPVPAEPVVARWSPIATLNLPCKAVLTCIRAKLSRHARHSILGASLVVQHRAV